MSTKETALIELPQDIDKSEALALQKSFMPLFTLANEWTARAKAITVTNIEQVEEMQQARAARLKLKEIRVDADKLRKELKAESLLKGKAIDGMGNIIKFLIVPIEEHLQKQEDFIKNEKAKIREALVQERTEKLTALDVDTTFYNLGDMPTEAFDNLLETSKIGHERKVELERQAEAERVKKEQEEREERERVRLENEKLRTEAAEREKEIAAERKKQAEIQKKAAAKVQKEREAAEAKAAKERAVIQEQLDKARKEREQLEAEAQAKRNEEARIERERLAGIEAEKKAIEATRKEAELAPDKDKLNELAVKVTQIQLPDVSSDGAKEILAEVTTLLNKISAHIKTKSLNL